MPPLRRAARHLRIKTDHQKGTPRQKRAYTEPIEDDQSDRHSDGQSEEEENQSEDQHHLQQNGGNEDYGYTDSGSDEIDVCEHEKDRQIMVTHDWVKTILIPALPILVHPILCCYTISENGLGKIHKPGPPVMMASSQYVLIPNYPLNGKLNFMNIIIRALDCGVAHKILSYGGDSWDIGRSYDSECGICGIGTLTWGRFDSIKELLKHVFCWNARLGAYVVYIVQEVLEQ
jgi:hypothetical protein